MQGVAGGLRAEFAIVLQASIPERLATLMRKLDGDPDQHPEEVCDYWIIPTETQSGADHRGRRELRRLTVALLEEGELETIECESAAAPTRMVSAAGLAPTSGNIVTQIQLGGSRTDSLVRILHAQPASKSLGPDPLIFFWTFWRRSAA